jgi:site-specific DNA-methyltransferase (cytosine-N4-specific)
LDYEIIYHLSKGDDIYLNEDCGIHDPLSSVWNVPHNIPKNERLHPTQMPEALVDRILKVASRPSDLVYDSFMGSGTTAQVAQDLGRKYLGCELNPAYQPLQNKRLAQQSLELL